MPNKYHSIATQSQKEALFAHGPHIANLLIDSMEPTKMSPTELFNRYRDERHPRPGEKFTEWALIHFGYISLKNVGDSQAIEDELIGHMVTNYMPEFNTGEELQALLESRPRVDGEATDADLLRMDLDNVEVIGLDTIGVRGIRNFCNTLVSHTCESIAA